jgi:hypothetical protein
MATATAAAMVITTHKDSLQLKLTAPLPSDSHLLLLLQQPLPPALPPTHMLYMVATRTTSPCGMHRLLKTEGSRPPERPLELRMSRVHDLT